MFLEEQAIIFDVCDTYIRFQSPFKSNRDNQLELKILCHVFLNSFHNLFYFASKTPVIKSNDFTLVGVH